MSHDRPSSAHPTRPESPRRPSPVMLDPLPPRPPSASSHRNHLSPRAPSPSSPGGRITVGMHNMDLSQDMHAWLQANMPPVVQAGLNTWCNTHAQPLLGGFLEQWMTLNSQQVVQNLLAAHLGPMQQAIQQQQQMIAELQNTVTSQAAKIHELEKRPIASTPPQNNHHLNEPAPFTPTLPFALGGSPVVPTSSTPPSSHHPSTTPPMNPGLGLKGTQRPPSAGLRHPLAGANLEDGVEAPFDPRKILMDKYQQQSGGSASGRPLGIGLVSGSASTPGPGEVVASEQEKRLSPGGPRTAPAKSKAAGPIDIIVVEDLKMAQKIAHAALTRAHYKVDLAGDGPQAIELFKQHMGSLKAVLMDIHLPGISGIETTERIRKLEREAGVAPVYIYGLTGDVAEDDLVKYKACGMNGCILKGKLLADAVKQAMEESQSGVDFVNLCDKQGGSSSSQAQSASATASGISARASLNLQESGLAPQQIEKARASPMERIRQETQAGQSNTPLQFGTPRAPQPRVILGDKYQGHGISKPGIGLGGGSGSQFSSGGVGSPERSVPPQNQPAGPNLLLVEDVRVSRRVANKALTNMAGMNFKVVEAEDGESAIEKFKQHSGSLKYIIMDINLPGISGIEATEQIRLLEKTLNPEEGGAIILGLTGNVDAESMRQYEICGMNGCILKGKPLTEAVSKAIEEASEGKFVNIS